MLKEGMKIEATHVKKKQLHHYLPAEILQKKKKVSSSQTHDPGTGFAFLIAPKPIEQKGKKGTIQSRTKISLSLITKDTSFYVLQN